MQRKLLHRPIGLWVEIVLLSVMTIWSLLMRNQFNMIFCAAVSIYALVHLLRRRMTGFIAAQTANVLIIYAVFLFLLPSEGMRQSITLTTNHKVISIFLVTFAIVGSWGLQTNRRWFDEIMKRIDY